MSTTLQGAPPTQEVARRPGNRDFAGGTLRHRCRLWAIFVLCAISSIGLHAQVSAALSGRVTDQTGAAVGGATVEATNVETGIKRTATATDSGRYLFVALPIGHYQLRAQKTGFAEEIRSGIVLVVGEDATADLHLRVGSITEQVKVTDNVPVVNTTTQDISGLVGEKEVKDLPLNGRSFDLLLTLNPGIVNFTSEKTGGIGVSNSTTGNNFSVSGNRPQQNLFLLNGVEFTGAAENNMQPGGASQNLLGVEAVREFNVLRDTYGAEYGKRPGRAGHHRHAVGHATSGMARCTNSCATTRSTLPIISTRARLRRSSATSSAQPSGGPIQKDKTFFFANYEGFSQNLHQTSVAFVPDLASRAAAVAQRSAAAESVAHASGRMRPTSTASPQVFSSPLQTIREDFGTARFDHVFSPKDTFSAVYTIDDGDDVTPTTVNPYSTDILTLARAGREPGGDARLFADAAERRALRLFARGLLLHRRAHAGHSRRRRSRLPRRASGRRGGGRRKRGLQSAGADWPGGQQQRQQSAPSPATSTPTKTT